MSKNNFWKYNLLLILFFFSYSIFAKDTKKLDIIYFFDETCVKCEAFAEELSQIELENKNTINIQKYSINNLENIDLLEKYEQHFNIYGREIPIVIAGEKFIAYPDNMGKSLRDEIDNFKKNREIKTPLFSIENEESQHLTDTVFLLYFYKKGCSSCNKLDILLNIYEKEKKISIKKLNVENKESKIIYEVVAEKQNLPYEKHFSTPMLFKNSHFSEPNKNAFEKFLSENRDSNVPFWENITESEKEKAVKKIFSYQNKFSLSAIIIAGLIDGINPCAFATIIFFITYLTFIGRKKQHILLVGLSFSLSVFLTYLFLGFGLFKSLLFIGQYKIFYLATFLIIGLITLTLTIFALYDICKYMLTNKTEDMLLQLNKSTKQKIHNKIRNIKNFKSALPLILITIFTGIWISLLELACTGQVYLPVLAFIAQSNNLNGQTIKLLIIYNIMFILPLILIFLLSFLGVSSEKIGHFFKRNILVSKISIFFLFLFFTIILFKEFLFYVKAM